MNNVYIGARYVPIFDGDWSNIKSYEPLTIVNYGNNSYTSKRPVPVGIAPTNSEYWALTGNYNGQISNLQNEIDTLRTDVQGEIDTLTANVGTITEDVAEVTTAIEALKNHYNESTLSIFKNKRISKKLWHNLK